MTANRLLNNLRKIVISEFEFQEYTLMKYIHTRNKENTEEYEFFLLHLIVASLEKMRIRDKKYFKMRCKSVRKQNKKNNLSVEEWENDFIYKSFEVLDNFLVVESKLNNKELFDQIKAKIDRVFDNLNERFKIEEKRIPHDAEQRRKIILALMYAKLLKEKELFAPYFNLNYFLVILKESFKVRGAEKVMALADKYIDFVANKLNSKSFELIQFKIFKEAIDKYDNKNSNQGNIFNLFLNYSF